MGQIISEHHSSTRAFIRSFASSCPKMKLFILAALIAISSAARLEHLERSYLPPDQGGQGQFGGRGQGGFNQGSNSLGFSSPGSNSFGSQGSNFRGASDSTGFGSAPQGSRTGPAGIRGASSFEAAQSNQYLPPDHGPSAGNVFSGSRGQDSFGASSNQFGSKPQFGQSHGFGSQGSHGFGSQGSHGFGSQGHSGFGSQGSNGFGSQGSQGPNGFGSNARSQQQNSLRQYLAPKASSSFDRIPQQDFDEETGYHY